MKKEERQHFSEESDLLLTDFSPSNKPKINLFLRAVYLYVIRKIENQQSDIGDMTTFTTANIIFISSHLLT